MDVFKDKRWVKLNRMSDEYKKCLDAFLDHAFATSAIDNTTARPYALCCNRFYYDRDIVRGHLFMKVMDVDHQKGIWVLYGEQSITDCDSDDDIVDDEFTWENHE